MGGVLFSPFAGVLDCLVACLWGLALVVSLLPGVWACL